MIASGFSRDVLTTVAVSSSVEPEMDTHVVELLREALESLGPNHRVAAAYVAKACSALRAGSDADASKAFSTARSYVRGGLLLRQSRRVQEYIEENLDKPLSVEELSALARLSRSYFQRAFKTTFGVGPHAFVVQRRIRRAQELMLSTDQSLSQIALAVGFSDQSHFTTRFLHANGTTPGHWRRERKDSRDAA